MKISNYIKALFKYKVLSTKFPVLCILSSLLLLTACSDKKTGEPDLPGDEQIEGTLRPTDKVYLTLNVQMPSATGSRSQTSTGGASSDGTEPGTDAENTVNTATIYFYQLDSDVDSDGTLTYLTQFTAEATVNGGKYTVSTEVQPNELKVLGGKQVLIFVAANGTPSFDEGSYGKDPEYATMSWSGIDVDGEPLGDFGDDGTGHSVPMCNKSAFGIDLTGLDDTSDAAFLTSLTGYMQTGRKFDLSKIYSDQEKSSGNNSADGTLDLERVVARVDVKPSKGFGMTADNMYAIAGIDNLYGLLTDMQVFNVRNKSNAFRQVSSGTYTKADGLDNRADILDHKYFTLLGDENGGGSRQEGEGDAAVTVNTYNWIADCDWYEKTGSAYTLGAYNLPAKGTGETHYYVHGDAGKISMTRLGDREKKDSEGFIPWCYISENTVPSTELMVRKYSTGVAFHVKLVKEDGSALQDADFVTQAQYDAIEDDEDKVGKVVVTQKPTRSGSSNFYTMKIGNQTCWLERKEIIPQGEENPDLIAGDPEPEEPGEGGNSGETEENDYYYEMVYYYFFQHNVSATHVKGQEDPMQYAVVRNNIYKISVTALNGVPVPFDPEEPDEPQNYYISVSIKVLAWARRDINVSF